MVFRLRLGIGVRRRERLILLLVVLIFLVIFFGGTFFLPQEEGEKEGFVLKIQRIFHQKSPIPIKPPKDYGKFINFIMFLFIMFSIYKNLPVYIYISE